MKLWIQRKIFRSAPSLSIKVTFVAIHFWKTHFLILFYLHLGKLSYRHEMAEGTSSQRIQTFSGHSIPWKRGGIRARSTTVQTARTIVRERQGVSGEDFYSGKGKSLPVLVSYWANCSPSLSWNLSHLSSCEASLTAMKISLDTILRSVVDGEDTRILFVDPKEKLSLETTEEFADDLIWLQDSTMDSDTFLVI